MPVVSIQKSDLETGLKRNVDKEQLEDLCFKYGVELDDITCDSEQGNEVVGEDRVIQKIDVPANRYDLLCVEGIVQAFSTYLGMQEMPRFTQLDDLAEQYKIIIDPSVKAIRGKCVGCVIKDVNLTQQSQDSFIALQDKLHQNICRRRKLVSVGTHDLAKIKGPITQKAVPRKDLKFIALKQTEELSAEDLLNKYRKDNYLKEQVTYLDHTDAVPVHMDADGKVLSMPPIINSEATKMEVGTKDIFVEITALDENKARIVLNMIIACLGVQNNFQVHSVKVEDSGETRVYPVLTEEEFECEIEQLKSLSGVRNIETEEICTNLKKMGIRASQAGKGIKAIVPITRPDVLHACDIAEDLAIAYGYEKLTYKMPPNPSVGRQQQLNSQSEMLKNEVVGMGYSEIITFGLTQIDEQTTYLQRGAEQLCIVSNPKSIDCQCPRTSLVPGLLKTFQSNKGEHLPIDLFELGDVVLIDDGIAVNQRSLCVASMRASSNLEAIHGALDQIALVMGFEQTLENSKEKMQINNRGVDIIVNGTKVGNMGIIHPFTLSKFEVNQPVTLLELNLQKIKVFETEFKIQ